MKTKIRIFRWLALLLLLAGSTGVWAQGPYLNSGDHTVCLNSVEPYGVNLTIGSTYVWTITPLAGGNGTIVNGPTANLINVTWNSVGTATLQLLETNSSGCNITVSIIVTIQQPATVNAGIDQIACATSPIVTLAGVIGGSASSASWSGGTGTYNPNANTLTATYTPSAAEILAGTVTLTLTTDDPAGPCPAVSDQMTISINPDATANAGADQTVCATSPNVTLAGIIGGAASSATWSGGTGSFAPNATTLNAVYTPSAGEITAGTVTLTLTTNDPAGLCGAVSDQMVITIDPAATVNAGVDQTVCATTPIVTLAGTFGGSATSATWTGGAGVFAPNATTMNATYTPSAGEITAGTVTLTLTTNDPAGLCGAVNDQMTITIDPAAIVNAGVDQTVCASTPTVTLAGTIGGSATSATWSGGTGVFAPDATSLTATYTPSAAEITAGSVTLILTSNDPAGLCGIVTDQMIITIDPAATVNAGVDQTACATSPAVTLAGTIGGAAGSATWSGGTGTFAPNAFALNATYTPSAAEITAGTVTLTLTTDNPAGLCGAVTDQMTITINPQATVSAGLDQTVCETTPAVTLAGTIGGAASSATWTGGLGTFVPDATTLNAVYTPDASEILAGTVTLTLTTNDPGGLCGAVSDQMTITINPAATANAGADQTVCATSPVVTLAGSVGGAAVSGTWSGGGGTFAPNAFTLNAAYTPSAGEITAGTVTLTLTTDDPAGLCGPVTDQMIITINPEATVNAGADQITCASSPAVTLNGTIGGAATSATWSGGAGTFAPNATTLNATYTPNAVEIAAGTVTLTLTTNDPLGLCGPVSDQMTITINPAATANAGVDQTVCSSSPVTTLNGSVGGSATTGTWSGGGGTFAPNAFTLNATYTPSAAEIAAGTVTLTLTTDDPAGICPAVTDQMVITINAAPVPTITGTTPVCQNSTGIVYTTEAGMTNYSWTIVGGTITSGNGTNSVNVTWTTAGAQSISVAYTGLNSCNPSAPTVYPVLVNPIPNTSTIYHN